MHGRTPLLRLQSDERLITLVRRGSTPAFEVLVSRYQSRLLAFCRHLLGSKEDAEDVLQEVFAAAFNAMIADDRPINVRPWLYRIARNRSLNHLRRVQAIGVDSMDVHLSEFGTTTADKVHEREQFRLLVGDIQSLPETQRTALVLREMDALPYDQIAEAMDTTVPGVKSLLVRARISLAEAAEARHLSCDDVRIELAEVAEGLQKRPTAVVRRHLRSCTRCESFHTQLKHTNKALAALLPLGPMALIKQLLVGSVHIGHSAGTGSGATAGAASATGAAGATGATTGATASGVAAGQAAAIAGTAGGGAAVGSAGSLISAGAGALASKAAAGLAAAAIVTAGAVEASHTAPRHQTPPPPPPSEVAASGGAGLPTKLPVHPHPVVKVDPAAKAKPAGPNPPAHPAKDSSTPAGPATSASPTNSKTDPKQPGKAVAAKTTTDAHTTPAGQTQTQTVPTVLSSSSAAASPGGATDMTGAGGTAPSTTVTASTIAAPPCPPATDTTSTTPAAPATTAPAAPSCAPSVSITATDPSTTGTPTTGTPTTGTPTSPNSTTTTPGQTSTPATDPTPSGGAAPAPAPSAPSPAH